MKAILNKINEINALINEVNELESYPTTYAGGTFPHYVLIKPIKVKNQFVTIESDINSYSFIDKKERYNVNKTSVFGDEYCKKHLVYTLNIILKTFKQAIYSFVGMLDEERRTKLENDTAFKEAMFSPDNNDRLFEVQFVKKYGRNPIDAKEQSFTDIMEKELQKSRRNK